MIREASFNKVVNRVRYPEEWNPAVLEGGCRGPPEKKKPSWVRSFRQPFEFPPSKDAGLDRGGVNPTAVKNEELRSRGALPSAPSFPLPESLVFRETQDPCATAPLWQSLSWRKPLSSSPPRLLQRVFHCGDIRGSPTRPRWCSHSVGVIFQGSSCRRNVRGYVSLPQT